MLKLTLKLLTFLRNFFLVLPISWTRALPARSVSRISLANAIPWNIKTKRELAHEDRATFGKTTKNVERTL